jgi:hypothetical protein
LEARLATPPRLHPSWMHLAQHRRPRLGAPSPLPMVAFCSTGPTIDSNAVGLLEATAPADGSNAAHSREQHRRPLGATPPTIASNVVGLWEQSRPPLRATSSASRSNAARRCGQHGRPVRATPPAAASSTARCLEQRRQPPGATPPAARSNAARARVWKQRRRPLGARTPAAGSNRTFRRKQHGPLLGASMPRFLAALTPLAAVP